MPTPYDNKDCTGWDLSDRTDMDGLVIEGLCLSQAFPNSHVLPESLTGVTFSYCNLDNVFMPPGNTVENCSTRCWQAQNDGEDWLLDPDTLEPIAPLNGDGFERFGLSQNPKDLPKEPLDKSILQIADAALAEAKETAAKEASDAVTVADIDIGAIAVEATP